MRDNGQFLIARGQSPATHMKLVEPIFVTELFCQIHGELLSLLRNLSADDWSKGAAARLWTVKDIAAHLLDTDIRRLSYRRDKMPMVPPEAPIENYRDLVNFLNQLNADWIKAARRISPRLLIEFLEVTGAQVCELFKSLDPFAPASFGVAWAGEQESQNWFVIARETTEMASAYAKGSECLDPDIDMAKQPESQFSITLSKVELLEPTAPQVWLWIDNMFIAIYSSMFVLGYLCVKDWNPTRGSKHLFLALASLAAAGGMADYIENFLLLGGLSSGNSAIGHVAREAAPFTEAKFLLFGANLIILTILLVHVAIRRRTRRS